MTKRLNIHTVKTINMNENRRVRTTATSISLDATVFLKLRRIADNENRSLSNLINHISERFIFDIQERNPELLQPKKIKGHE